jgi:hypothetical protein
MTTAGVQQDDRPTATPGAGSVASGPERMRAVVARGYGAVYPFERIADAHGRVDGRRKRGSVVATLAGGA